MFVDTYTIQINDLTIPAKIGVFHTEKRRKQPLIINLDLRVKRSPGDHYLNVLCYKEVADALTELAVEQHWELLETLANEMVSLCMNYKQVLAVKVALSKPESLDYAKAATVIMEANKKTAEHQRT